MAGRRSRFRGIRFRLALALLVVVAGSLGVVYLIVVPSLERRLVDARLVGTILTPPVPGLRG